MPEDLNLHNKKYFHIWAFRSKYVTMSGNVSHTVELHLTGRILSGLPINLFGLAFRLNLSRILQN